ncbi:MAG TPA: hypothetical protein VEL70_02570 [Candidatus Acidoferrum sp.]|nr:hypothetical protein [Candidatus Acidoferrum sp.]
MTMKSTHTSLTIIVILAGLALITASTFVTPAFALKRYFNCMTEIANKAGQLTLQDVNSCYDKEFHSSQGSSGSSTSGGK